MTYQTQQYLIPQEIIDYTKTFIESRSKTHTRFRLKTYIDNAPNSLTLWSDQIGYNVKYIYYAILRNYNKVPIVCLNCNKPLKLSQIIPAETGKYCCKSVK